MPVTSVTVTSGQTLSQIAREHHISLAELLAANEQFDPGLLGKKEGKWFDPKGPRDKGPRSGPDPAG